MFKLFKPFEVLPKSQNNIVIACWLLLIIGIWVISSFVGTTHLFPTISQVGEGFNILWNLGLVTHVLSSLGLFLKATLYSIIISCLVSYLSPLPFFTPVANFVSSFRFLPLAGVTLYISFLIHNARSIQITVLVIFMSLFLITSILQVLKGLDEDINHAKTLGCNRWEILLEVIIKGRIDYVIEAVRQNLAIIWMMLVVVEMINTSSGGLGLLIGNAQKNGSQGQVVALQIIILVFGKLLDILLTQSRRMIFRYSNF